MRTNCLLDLVGGIEVFVYLDNRKFLLLKSNKELDKIHYILKFFPEFSLCHLTWMKLLPGDHTFSMPSLTKGTSKFHLKFSSKFSSVTLKLGKGLLSPQSHVIIHINYPLYLWFLSPLTLTLMRLISTLFSLYISYF